MSDDPKKKNPIAFPAPNPADPVPVAHLWFVDALDFPGVQVSNVPCGAEPTKAGTSYVCWYIPAWHSFELTCAMAGKITEQRMIPSERVKQWKRAQ